MITKSYTKTGRSCRVTFEVPADVNAENVSLVGDFNSWDQMAHPMKRKRDGSFSTTVSLKPGQRYHFRYLLDGDRWINDPGADGHISNPYGTEDSVIEV